MNAPGANIEIEHRRDIDGCPCPSWARTPILRRVCLAGVCSYCMLDWQESFARRRLTTPLQIKQQLYHVPMYLYVPLHVSGRCVRYLSSVRLSALRERRPPHRFCAAAQIHLRGNINVGDICAGAQLAPRSLDKNLNSRQLWFIYRSLESIYLCPLVVFEESCVEKEISSQFTVFVGDLVKQLLTRALNQPSNPPGLSTRSATKLNRDDSKPALELDVN